MKTCCICGEWFEGFGNNPQPLRERGRCCDDCNEQVLYVRLVRSILADREAERKVKRASLKPTSSPPVLKSSGEGDR